MHNFSFIYSINSLLGCAMWILGSFAFFVECLIRVAPSSIVPSLMSDFHASTFDISAFGAYFLYAYFLMQIPVGFIVDRLGPFYPLAIATGLCAISTLFFSFTDNLHLAQFNRFLFGIGAAFALIGTLKIASLNFNPSSLSIFISITSSLGMIGSAIGTTIMGRINQTMGWQQGFQLFAYVLLGVTFLMSFFSYYFHIHHFTKTADKLKNPIKFNFKTIFQSTQTWVICIFAGLLYAPTAIFAELWGSFYLTHSQHLSAVRASDGISAIFLGFALGSPLLSLISNQFGRRPLLIFVSFASLLLLFLILYLPPYFYSFNLFSSFYIWIMQ